MLIRTNSELKAFSLTRSLTGKARERNGFATALNPLCAYIIAIFFVYLCLFHLGEAVVPMVYGVVFLA